MASTDHAPPDSHTGPGPLHILGLTAVALAVAATLFELRVPAQAPAVSENAAVAGLEPKFVDVGGVRTRYYEYGQGEPMILVHGGGRGTTSSANNWSPVIPLLARRFHVLAVDKSAAGMTGNPLDDRDLVPQGGPSRERRGVLVGEGRDVASYETALGEAHVDPPDPVVHLERDAPAVRGPSEPVHVMRVCVDDRLPRPIREHHDDLVSRVRPVEVRDLAAGARSPDCGRLLDPEE